MGLLKDMWEIVDSDPDVRKWIKEHATKSYNQMRSRLFRRQPKLNEVVDQQRIFCSELLQNNDFIQSFSSRLDFLTFVFCQIVRSVMAKERGVLIKNFYLPDAILYFPVPTYDPKLIKWVQSWDSGAALKHGHGPSDYYYFYGIRGASLPFESLRSKLDEIALARRTRSEEWVFRDYLKNEGMDTSRMAELRYFHDEKVIALTDTLPVRAPTWELMILDFREGDRTRQMIGNDVLRLLDFRMI